LGRISLKNAFIFPGTPFESRKVRFKIENPSAPEEKCKGCTARTREK
jgi:hypothetical protein